MQKLNKMIEPGKCYTWNPLPDSKIKFWRNLYNNVEDPEGSSLNVSNLDGFVGVIYSDDSFLVLEASLCSNIYLILKDEIVGFCLLFPDECVELV